MVKDGEPAIGLGKRPGNLKTIPGKPLIQNWRMVEPHYYF